MGQCCKFFCTECTETHDHYKCRDGVEASIEPLVDDHKDGCIFEVATLERRFTVILKEEVKDLKAQIRALERRRKQSEEGLLGLRKEQLEKRESMLEKELLKETPTRIEVLKVETRHNVEYPTLERCYEDPNCDHHWHNHSCACYKILGDVFLDFYGQSYEELLADFDAKKWSAHSDVKVIEMELEYARDEGLPRKEVSMHFCSSQGGHALQHLKFVVVQ